MAFDCEIKTKHYILPVTLILIGKRKRKHEILTLEWRVQRTHCVPLQDVRLHWALHRASPLGPHLDAILVCKIRRY